jgi:alcohol dehydrogenase, propanol-preferring
LRSHHGLLEVEERPSPVGSDVIDVVACGVCHSDLHVVDGDYPSPLPLVLGHEVTGMHPELGPVMVYAPWGCRNCPMCASGQEMLCPNGKEIGLFQDGGYTERFAVKDRAYLHSLGSLDPVQAAPLACGGLTAYRAVKHGLRSLSTMLGGGSFPRALVIGAGGLGQFAIQYLRLLTDANVTVVDTSPSKCERATELGAHEAGDASILGDSANRFDVVIDFVGSNATLAMATSTVRRQGLVVVVGLFGGRIPFGLGAVPHEARFMTSIWGSNEELGELVALAQREQIRYTVEVMALDRAQEAHDRLRRGDVDGRFVLVPNMAVQDVAVPNMTVPNMTVPNMTVPNVTVPNVGLGVTLPATNETEH